MSAFVLRVQGMVKLLSWNLNRRALWADLAADDSVDVALLQEAPRPTAENVLAVIPDQTADWHTQGWPTELRSCVVQLSDRIRLVPRPMRDAHEEADALGVSRRGTLTVADLHRGDDFLFTVASVYSAWEHPTAEDSLIYADASAHRLLSDLAPLVSGRPRVDLPILVAGDFNLMYGYAEEGNAYWATRYRSVFDRAEAMGLVFVGPQAPNGRQADPWPSELPLDSHNVPTFHHSRQTPETATRQLDYVFASRSIADRISVKALNEPADWGSSDHCRVEITVDIQ
jgi:hypothetical protein